MTDKMKNGLNATLAVFAVVFMGFIATGVGYLVVKGDQTDAYHEKRLKDLEIISYNLGKECVNFIEWQRNTDRTLKEHQKEFMEIWKQVPRGGTIKKTQ
jgi:hypothetical protein